MSLTSPLGIIILVLGATVVTQVYFVSPHLQNGAYDIASAQWFVFCPLYLFTKRKWTSVYLSPGRQLGLDIVSSAMVHMSLISILLSSLPEYRMRIICVWAVCIILTVVTFLSKPNDVRE